MTAAAELVQHRSAVVVVVTPCVRSIGYFQDMAAPVVPVWAQGPVLTSAAVVLDARVVSCCVILYLVASSNNDTQHNSSNY